ncbi:YciI family protein [Celerinatantimonas sp. MCCC 1A17872]|uniref:YciI family protein n=1 Tax=Celerinatantimonas sp. MCCC 1A17872 TaxID=3177514 RepID=UPI0038BFAC2F
MSIYLVKMEHPDGPEWAEHVVEHVEYLQTLIAQKTLIASGPLTTGSLRAGFLIFHAQSEQDVRQLVDNDPFAREGLIATL